MGNIENSEPLVFDPKRPRRLRRRGSFVGPVIRSLDQHRARRIIAEVDKRLALRSKLIIFIMAIVQQ